MVLYFRVAYLFHSIFLSIFHSIYLSFLLSFLHSIFLNFSFSLFLFIYSLWNFSLFCTFSFLPSLSLSFLPTSLSFLSPSLPLSLPLSLILSQTQTWSAFAKYVSLIDHENENSHDSWLNKEKKISKIETNR